MSKEPISLVGLLFGNLGDTLDEVYTYFLIIIITHAFKQTISSSFIKHLFITPKSINKQSNYYY